jgi:hypothetical protein
MKDMKHFAEAVGRSTRGRLDKATKRATAESPSAGLSLSLSPLCACACVYVAHFLRRGPTYNSRMPNLVG